VRRGVVASLEGKQVGESIVIGRTIRVERLYEFRNMLFADGDCSLAIQMQIKR
jgi:hypothetical protein